MLFVTTGSVFADLSDGLVGYWSFNDETDPGQDYSGMGNDGIVNGAISVTGKIGNGLWFDGIDDNVLVPDNDTLDFTGTGTISAFIKLDDSFSTRAGIISKMIGSDSGQVSYEIMYAWDDPGPWTEGLVGYIADSTTADQFPTYSVDLRGEWHHVAMTWDGSNVSGYLDGEIVAIAQQNRDAMVSTFDVYIGRHFYSPTGHWYSFFGEMDDVRIYNRALSESEIQQLSVVPIPGAVLLGMLGFGVAGMKLRKYA